MIFHPKMLKVGQATDSIPKRLPIPICLDLVQLVSKNSKKNDNQ